MIQRHSQLHSHYWKEYRGELKGSKLNIELDYHVSCMSAQTGTGTISSPSVSWPLTICTRKRHSYSSLIWWRQGLNLIGSLSDLGAFFVSRLKLSHAERGGSMTMGLRGADKMELVWFKHTCCATRMALWNLAKAIVHTKCKHHIIEKWVKTGLPECISYAEMEGSPADLALRADSEDTPFTGNIYSQAKNQHFIHDSE